MSATFSTFCNDAIFDASIRMPKAPVGDDKKKLMYLSITTDTGDYLTIHFKNESNFKAFCAKHNFQLEIKTNATN
ncbi:hypothetical protein [Cellvibrio sp. QJXJ]|uniref:hypothetical protein n=1 Tax=Cellvibrio sp. QJXJ TaxID=2964606 RepID=UPI0021C30C6E|nr:hypothetical protein [Cellvibrio sp. QJXJ]UUA73073.1 hypothetical protein NNX04_01170 [Cellvibrio sp. QJXJ]